MHVHTSAINCCRGEITKHTQLCLLNKMFCLWGQSIGCYCCSRQQQTCIKEVSQARYCAGQKVQRATGHQPCPWGSSARLWSAKQNWHRRWPGQKSKDWLSGSPLLCRKSEASRVAINHYWWSPLPQGKKFSEDDPATHVPPQPEKQQKHFASLSHSIFRQIPFFGGF